MGRIGQPFVGMMQLIGPLAEGDADEAERYFRGEWTAIVRANNGVALSEYPDTVERVTNLHYGKPMYDGQGRPVLDPAGEPSKDPVAMVLVGRGYAIRGE